MIRNNVCAWVATAVGPHLWVRTSCTGHYFSYFVKQKVSPSTDYLHFHCAIVWLEKNNPKFSMCGILLHFFVLWIFYPGKLCYSHVSCVWGWEQCLSLDSRACCRGGGPESFLCLHKSCFSKVCEAILSLAHCDYLYKEKNKVLVLWPIIVFLVWNSTLQPCEWTLIPGWYQFWRTIETWDKTAIFCLLQKE